MFFGFGPHYLFGPLLNGVGDPEQRELPLGRSGVAPGLERFLGHLESSVYVFRTGERGLGESLSGRRVHEVVGLAIGWVYVLPADEVLYLARLRVH